MSFGRVANLYIDVDAYGNGSYPLLRYLHPYTDGSVTFNGRVETLRTNPTWVLKDQVVLRANFLRRTSERNGATPVRLAGGSTMGFRGKINFAGGTLFHAPSFTEVHAGDGVYYYEAPLSLNTVELIAAIDTAASLACKCDLEIRDAGLDERLSFQFDATILQEIYETVDDPEEIDLTYPAAEDIVVKHRGTHAMTAKEDTVDISGAGFSTPPTIIATAKHATSVIFCTVKAVRADEFDVEVSGDWDGAEIMWLAID